MPGLTANHTSSDCQSSSFSAAKITGSVDNADDLILGRGDLGFLRRTFGERLTLYPRGGHCGNLNYRVNGDAMLEFFRG